MSFKVCTWNIWFDHIHQEERINNAMNELQLQQPEVICLQEVTKPMLHFVFNHPICVDYNVLYDQHSTESYGEVFLLRRDRPVTNFYSIPFRDSNMGRRIYVLDTEMCQTRVRVINVHLESEFSGHPKGIKAQQLDQLLKFAWGANEPYRRVIIAGDTNLTDRDDRKWAVDLLKRLDCIDLKPVTAVPIYTYDYKRNTNVLGKFQSRLDRFICKTGTVCQEYKLLGTTPFQTKSGEAVFPSDHFGVCISISL